MTYPFGQPLESHTPPEAEQRRTVAPHDIRNDLATLKQNAKIAFGTDWEQHMAASALERYVERADVEAVKAIANDRGFFVEVVAAWPDTGIVHLRLSGLMAGER
jgi:hypothetical protein